MSSTYTSYYPTTVVPSQYLQNILTLTESNTPLTFPSSIELGANYLAYYMFVTANSAGYYLTLPDARTAGTGMSSIFVNLGLNTYNIVDYANNLVVTVAPSEVWVVELKENDTQQGDWWAYQLGATTSQADAGALAGQGLAANGATSKLDVTNVVQQVGNPPTIDKTYQAKLVNWIGSSATFNLPPLNLSPGGVQNGFWFTLKNNSPSNGIINLVPPSGVLIDGLANLFVGKGQSLTIYFAGTQYITCALTVNTSSGAVELTPFGVRVINGTAENPSYSFINNPSTGIFTLAGADVRVSCNGVESLIINSTSVNLPVGNLTLNGDNILYYQGIYP